MRSLWISKTGMEAQQTQLDTIAHNLANVGTNGFKRGHAVFEDLIYQNLRQAGANSSEQTQLPTGLQVGLGVRPVSLSRNFSQGNLQQTGNTLDIAIKGNGFFSIQMPDGSVAYTRDGAFQVDAQGQVVTNNGFIVQPGITIPANAQSVTIAADGDLSADPNARVQDGALEGSNVSAVETMIAMIAAARQFEAQMKLLQTAEADEKSASQLLAPSA
jgi:flagellar basal-body rod protein FlgG